MIGTKMGDGISSFRSGALVSPTWISHGESLEGLKELLLLTSLELESTRATAKDHESNVKFLMELLKATQKERDEAREQCLKMQEIILKARLHLVSGLNLDNPAALSLKGATLSDTDFEMNRHQQPEVQWHLQSHQQEIEISEQLQHQFYERLEFEKLEVVMGRHAQSFAPVDSPEQSSNLPLLHAEISSLSGPPLSADRSPQISLDLPELQNSLLSPDNQSDILNLQPKSHFCEEGELQSHFKQQQVEAGQQKKSKQMTNDIVQHQSLSPQPNFLPLCGQAEDCPVDFVWQSKQIQGILEQQSSLPQQTGLQMQSLTEEDQVDRVWQNSISISTLKQAPMSKEPTVEASSAAQSCFSSPVFHSKPLVTEAPSTFLSQTSLQSEIKTVSVGSNDPPASVLLFPQPVHLPEPPEADPQVMLRSLPEKGKLLQAVMQAGPLLQTLLLAGPLPEWRHPPPPLRCGEIPPVSMTLSPCIPMPALVNTSLNATFRNCENAQDSAIMCVPSSSPLESPSRVSQAMISNSVYPSVSNGSCSRKVLHRQSAIRAAEDVRIMGNPSKYARINY